MKAHDGWLEVVQHVGGVGAEGRAQHSRGDGGQVELELLDSTAPARLATPASRSAFGLGGVWQKKLTLYGLVVCAAMCANSLRMASGLSIAQGSEPRPPGVRNGNGQAAVLDAGHGCLNDRELDAQESLQCHTRAGQALRCVQFRTAPVNKWR